MDGDPEEVFKEKDKLLSIGLDIPFILKIKSALKEKGIFVPKEIKDIKSLARYICNK